MIYGPTSCMMHDIVLVIEESKIRKLWPDFQHLDRAAECSKDVSLCVLRGTSAVRDALPAHILNMDTLLFQIIVRCESQCHNNTVVFQYCRVGRNRLHDA